MRTVVPIEWINYWNCLSSVDLSSILEPLNDAQRQAVTAQERNLLVIAGAGSGKTRVLAHRVAWYVASEQVSPFEVLAVTFTNKAAREMRGRIEALLSRSLQGMWVGTFHSLAHRMLRTHRQACDLPDAFQIIDTVDQQRIIRRILKEDHIDEKKFSARALQTYINRCKDKALRPGTLEDQGDHDVATQIAIYKRYQAFCEASGLVDFSEILLRAWELLSTHHDIAAQYRRRFPRILVDEFQDTSDLQYRWLMLVAGTEGSLFAVGDDDQSIYSWRGAQMQHMQGLQARRKETRVVRLEQNYRSTQAILDAANALIDHNQGRLGKKLWTAGQQGEPVQRYEAYSEYDEAQYVLDRIREAVACGRSWKDHAVLYRVSALSRVVEEVFMSSAVPYRVYGGMRFYDRAEIKDALAYLRLSGFPDDDTALERVFNTPVRGIGKSSWAVVREQARKTGVSLWQACVKVVRDQSLSKRPLLALSGFVDMLHQLQAEADSAQTLEAFVTTVLTTSGLLAHHQRDDSELGRSCLENLQELVSAASMFRLEATAEQDSSTGLLEAFVSHAALESDAQRSDTPEDCVCLMTLHAAKGLEFPCVFLLGMEEEILPHRLSLNDPGRLEEERRLCYVGITRAQQSLHLSCAKHRRLHGKDLYLPVSRFVHELPIGTDQPTDQKEASRRPDTASVQHPDGGHLAPGLRVCHQKFGEGTVLGTEGVGSDTRVQVHFSSGQCKWLLLSHAGLQIATPDGVA